MTEKEKLRRLMSTVEESLKGYDFIRRGNVAYVRDIGGITHVFQLPFVARSQGFGIIPQVGVRVERVEQLFHKVSNSRGHHGDTVTVGAAIGSFSGRHCEFTVDSQKDLANLTCDIVHVFETTALSYYARYSSLEAIDSELNDHPELPTPHRAMTWTRCATGLIVAKLRHRGDYEVLVKTYTDAVSRTDKGFFMPQFHKLVSLLRDVE